MPTDKERTLRAAHYAPQILKLSELVLAKLKRDGRLPVRLDEDDIADLKQEAVVACLEILPKFDPERGSMAAFMANACARAILRAAWRAAHCGITGESSSISVHSSDEDSGIVADLADFDVADEIEAFDHVWNMRYAHD